MKAKFSAVILLLIIANAPVLCAEDVKVIDIGPRVTLIGKLGKPLGTVIANIEGQLVSDPKVGGSGLVTSAVRVSKIDGKALEKTVIIGVVFSASVGTPNVHANDNFTFSGYEGGAYIGTPDAARETLGKAASSMKWEFASTLHIIKLL